MSSLNSNIVADLESALDLLTAPEVSPFISPLPLEEWVPALRPGVLENNQSTREKFPYAEVIETIRSLQVSWIRRGEEMKQIMENLGWHSHSIPCMWPHPVNGELDIIQDTNWLFTQDERDPMTLERAIWFLTHDDYVAGSGASDNASSMAVPYALASKLAAQPVELDTPLVIACFALEEFGCIGSFAVAEQLRRSGTNISRHDFFDLECLGYGSKIFLADSLENRLGNRVNMHPPLVNKLARAALLHNSEHKLIRGAFHWTADHVPFANIGAATAQICTGETTSGHDNLGSTRLDHIAHTSRDVRENIDIDNLASVTDILYTMLQRYEELG